MARKQSQNSFSKKYLTVLSALLFSNVQADQPVHCFKEQAQGSWDFHISPEQSTVNLFQTKEVCTHSLPNKVQIVSDNHQWQFSNDQIWRVNLKDGYQASAQQCSGKDKCDGGEVSGTWSTIYDQAFRVELENGMRFIANFRYNVKKSISDDPLADTSARFEGIKAGDYINFNSKCSETMVGFVQQVGGNGSTMTNHKAQCFFGKQVQATNTALPQEVSDGEIKIAALPSLLAEVETPQDKTDLALEEATLLQTSVEEKQDLLNYLGKRKSHTRHNLHHEHVPTDETDLLISTINSLDLGWKADVCKLQKHHANYGAHCEKPIQLAQTKSDTKIEEFGEHVDGFKAALGEAQKFKNKYSDAESIPDSELPESFDWRNVQGFNFMNDLRDQGHCGSCYTVSFTQIAENRLKIKYGKSIPLLSPQYLMTCNYLNEGCDGGWPFFHGFFSENGYMVTEECAPYQGKTKGDHCGNYAKCAPHSKIEKTYFVGKGYGDTSEKKMMKEIIRNGAVNGEMQAPRIFGMYKEGIFTSKGLVSLHKKLAQADSSQLKVDLSDKTLASYGISWQNLNHSVTIIGWGVDPATGTKFWIVRNSYGSGWGDNGDFLVERGSNQFAIEGETTAYEPVLCSESQC